jgi:uncharacterized protein HemX
MNSWVTAISSDGTPLLLVIGGVLLIAAAIGVALATWAQRRRERQREMDRATPERLDEAAIAHWVEEGRHLFNLWQERADRVAELHGRLAAMADQVEQLKAQVRRDDELPAENLRLAEEIEALRLEQDQLRTVVARIGELIQRASEARPGPAA